MVTGLRALAFILDLVIAFGTLPAVMMGTGKGLEKSGDFGFLLMFFWLGLFFLWPILYFALSTGIWGRTLGKLICRLSVIDRRGERPGFWRGVGREMLKLLALATALGALIALFQAIFQGITWYDQVCGTQVIFHPYVRLNKIQKNWRDNVEGR